MLERLRIHPRSWAPRFRWASGAVAFTIREPADGLDRARIRARRLLARGRPRTKTYESEPEWERRLHELLGATWQFGVVWPCPMMGEFDEVWLEIAGLVDAQGLALGRGTYGGWDDADRGLARAVWCLIAHLRPNKVVETGVARGITSRVILERLERNGSGHLWSVDLPSLDKSLHGQVGAAVPASLRPRWTYVRGTSRQRLPGLLAELGEIDMFVHDSSHTERNVRFELDRAWAAMSKGAIVADDVNQSPAFDAFRRARPGAPTVVARADDGKAQFAIALKRG
jgi:hypothetical protein